eukprot:NODE_1944_length_527_cov_9.663180_g1582_i0.p2 GENE.NODE_1944_length_527_cov_9.663180_g1582_i0~~NODE_1944_length_527_cov_9.663180_g1582_i0.p2  ORF type:complete len:110 (-),score=6.77 NODE_1944_length_527_cov_9.663180_g1582_i0:85-414(-)
MHTQCLYFAPFYRFSTCGSFCLASDKLVQAVRQAAGKKPGIGVLLHGSAVALSGIAEHLDGLIDAWYPGIQGGITVADAFGEYGFVCLQTHIFVRQRCTNSVRVLSVFV